MAKIQNVSADVKSAIQRKSAYSLPNNPTDSGYKASDIRNAFYKPIIDTANSAIAEIDRVINEINGALMCSSKNIDSIVSVAGVYYHGSDGFIYTFDNRTFAVKGYEGEASKISIPTKVYYDNHYYAVSGISESAFEGKSSITDVEIPANVETVEKRAFCKCSLSKVTFYGSTQLTGDEVFSNNIDFMVPKEHLSSYEILLEGYAGSVTGFNTILNNADNIVILFEDKLSKVTTPDPNQRVYAISETGAQITRKLVETPTDGEIPVYLSAGRIPVGTPTAADDATPLNYVERRLAEMGVSIDSQLAEMGAYIDFSINPTNYQMTLRLKNKNKIVLSEGVVDLPLESMILGASYADGVLTLNIKTADGTMNNTVIDVDISDLIRGLVNDDTFDAEIERLEGIMNSNADSANRKIDSTNTDLGYFKNEVAQKEIYAHAAFHSEESDFARNYTKGGEIDKAIRELDKRLKLLEGN